MELDAQQIDQGHSAPEPHDIAGEVKPKGLAGSSMEGIHDIAGGPDTLTNRHRCQGRIRPPLASVHDTCAIPDDVYLRELRDLQELIDDNAALRTLCGRQQGQDGIWGDD